MNRRRTRHGIALPLATMLGALALSIMPLPALLAPMRPDWVVLVLIYWALAAPGRFGLVTAFCMGLALDTLTGALLGQHALALLLVVYLSQRFYFRLRVFPASQMMLTVGVLLALYQFVLFWIDGVAGRSVPMAERWAPVLSGALLWALALAFVERGRVQAATRI
jgi:rod shape-determining protein MreD